MANIEATKIETKRHSLSHILAAAVLEMFPKAKLAIGPDIENGFYYDFDLPRALTPQDLPKIEKEMRKIIAQNIDFERIEKSVNEAISFEKKRSQIYKEELISDLEKEGTKEVSYYQSGKFIDLCAGPHVGSTKELAGMGFKLDKVAGAYWRGSEKNKMLQRIYALAFETPKELAQYLEIQQEAQKRDHRKLGPELGLFMFHDTAPGMPYWLPKGLVINNELINFWREEHQKRGYMEIKSPLINKKELYVTSGHWDHYREEMFISKTDEKETYALKPMNCPNAMIVYADKKRSYRELPLRLSDTDTLHRFERSGTLNGLLRAREFSQDDAHIFVAESQIESEVKNIMDIVERFYSIFGLEYSFRLGTRPDDFMGDPKLWDKAEEDLKNILAKSKKKYFVLEGDGAFYGPKIDILMKDSLGREWQMGTIQLDFQIPLRFGLSYVDKDGLEKTPVVLHRVVYGSIERFVGILTEHLAGAFPVWLAPVQVQIITVGASAKSFAQKVFDEMNASGVRAELKDENETVGKKIRDGEIQKVPYMIVIGDKEVASGQLAVRTLRQRQIKSVKVEQFIKQLLAEIKERK